MDLTLTMDLKQCTAKRIKMYVTRKQKLCYARYEKPLKNHPLEVAKKIAETHSSSNAAVHDPEQRVQLHKARQYTNAKEKEKTSEEDD